MLILDREDRALGGTARGNSASRNNQEEIQLSGAHADLLVISIPTYMYSACMSHPVATAPGPFSLTMFQNNINATNNMPTCLETARISLRWILTVQLNWSLCIIYDILDAHESV